MPKFLQPSLSGGELTPGMRGRVDLARYAVSLGKCRNMITKPTGGASKRTGTFMRVRVKHSDRPTRFVPFVYSTEVKYLIEMGDGYMRFVVNGALLTNATRTITGISNAATAVVTAAAHGFVTGDHVAIDNVRGLTRANGRTFRVGTTTANTFQLEGFDTSLDAAYAGGGSAGRIVEVITPYSGTMIYGVRFTQSADVMTLVHGDVPQKELRRIAADQFELRDFAFKRGPFRSFNADEAHAMAVDGTTGVVTISTNIDTFTAEMVGGLVYLEEKELQGVKPWQSAEKNVGVGAKRRSDSKVYRAVGIEPGGTYNVTGGVRPVHDSGRNWDGSGTKTDGVDTYSIGVNWEFLHNTFGIVQITEFVDAKTVRALVIERLPDSLVGTAPTPENSWTFSGDAATFTFAITGASSPSFLDYRVTINGIPVQSNPNYGGGGGVNSGGGGNPRPGNNFTEQVIL